MKDLINFLGTDKPAFDIEQAKEYANSIANSYLSSGVTPTDGLAKMASVEGFTPEQIKVIATETNKAIHSAQYKTASEKYHAADFPICDVKDVIAKLQLNDGEVKIAGSFVDPILTQKYSPDAEDMFGVKIEEMDKTASVQGQLKVASEKIELLSDKLSDSLSMSIYDVDLAEKAFIKKARATILEESESKMDRFQTMGNIYQAFAGGSLGEHVGEAMAKVAYTLGKEGLIGASNAKEAMEFFMSKTADQKAPEHLISKELTGVEIVNGQHPLYITLDTLATHRRAKENFENRYKKVQDTLEGLKQRIRSL